MAPPRIGVLIPKRLPVPEFLEFVVRLESCNVDGIWLAEDCFTAAGPTMAAMVLERTQRLEVGLGILPAPVRNVAFAAMEVATLANAHPGRLKVGIGHGVPEWMRQVGAWPTAPLAALTETITALRRLLEGQTLSVHGRHVRLERVKLDQPPSVTPPIFAGVRRAKSLKISGQVANGTILAEPSPPEYVRAARRLIDEGRSGSGDHHSIVVYNWFAPNDETSTRAVRAAIAEQMSPALDAQLDATGFGAELLDLARTHGDPSGSWLPDAWLERLAIWGGPDSAAARIAELAACGADWCVLVLPPQADRRDLAESIAEVGRVLRS